MDTDKVLDAANKLGEKMQELATAYGPQVADLAMVTARISAAQIIAVGVIGLVFAVWSTPKSIAKLRESVAEAKKPGWSNDEIPFALAGVAYGLIAVGGTISALSSLTNIFAWIGMFRPEVWIAARLLKL